MKPSLFVDSWGWIVLANPNEDGFKEAQSLYEEESRHSRPVTTDYILDEVITFLYSKISSTLAGPYLKGILNAIEGGKIQLETIGRERFQKAWKMRLKYIDQAKISFTDFTSFVVMQELSMKHTLTNDHHFETVNLGFQRLPIR